MTCARIPKDTELSAEANEILLNGDILDFLVFLNNPEISWIDM